MTNTTTIEGNLTGDPELRFTGGGKAVATFRVAVNRRWLDKSANEWKQEVAFFKCKVWGQPGENVVESLVKGDAVIVSGRFDEEKWTASDGSPRSVLVLVADSVGASLKHATASLSRNERREWSAAPAAAASPPNRDEDPF